MGKKDKSTISSYQSAAGRCECLNCISQLKTTLFFFFSFSNNLSIHYLSKSIPTFSDATSLATSVRARIPTWPTWLAGLPLGLSDWTYWTLLEPGSPIASKRLVSVSLQPWSTILHTTYIHIAYFFPFRLLIKTRPLYHYQHCTVVIVTRTATTHSETHLRWVPGQLRLLRPIASTPSPNPDPVAGFTYQA